MLQNDESEDSTEWQELKVTFYPELYLQRRIWILNVLRKGNITKILDVGCGEGQLLTVLCQPAPWLPPPPPSVLPPITGSDESFPTSPIYNDDVLNIHPSHVYGLDISAEDLVFAVRGTAPPQAENQEENGFQSYYNGIGQRWEDLEVKIWKGGLEVTNEEFIDLECIVSTEVIEHLPPNTFPAFAPIILGKYHPQYLLITTPSYTFNALFTAPGAPASARSGFKDPTGRTDRIFRHDDHKFEWTTQEFQGWCEETAKAWGYEVQCSAVGKALEEDPWGRDDELGGATSVAIFTRSTGMANGDRERKAEKILEEVVTEGNLHELLVTHHHVAHVISKKPKSLEEIADCVKLKMEEHREAFMRVEELWFEQSISQACGGWIEFLVRAIEESEFLSLKQDPENTKQRKGLWTVELVGGVANPIAYWPTEGDKSLDYIPPDWTPGEDTYGSSEGSEVDESVGAEGDISGNASEDNEEDGPARNKTLGSAADVAMWATEEQAAWASESDAIQGMDKGWNESEVIQRNRITSSPPSSAAGWEADASELVTE